MKNLLPNDLGSNAYLSNIAKKSHKNNQQKIKFIKNYKVSFPKYQGKVYDPTINKTLNMLKQSEEQMLKEINQRTNNINLLKSESNINNGNNIHDLINERKKLQDKIKTLEKENNLAIEKLGEIKNRRNLMQYQQEKELGILDNNKKLRLKKFVDDLNNKEKTEQFEEKMKKLQEDSKKIQLKMRTDLIESINRKNHKIDQLEKEKEEKFKKFKDEMKEKEKDDIKKRNQKAREEVLKLKELIDKKPIVTKHLYKANENKYLQKEEDLIKDENQKRKEYMKHIDIKEFNESAKNYDVMKSRQLSESNSKFKKEKQSWSKRYKLIPSYVNPLSKLIEEEKNLKKKEEEKENLDRLKFKNLQKNYKVPKPLIIYKEKNDNNDLGKRNKIKLIKSNSYSDILRQKVISKFNTSKSIEEKESNTNKNLEKETNKDIINCKLPLISLTNKYKKINKSFDKDKNNSESHQLTLDYLNHKRLINNKKRKKKRNNGEIYSLECSRTNDIKTLIKNNGLSEDTIKAAKSKLEPLDERRDQKFLFLKLNSGIENKQELEDEVCNLMIDSIKARLSIIQEIENLDENTIDNNIKKKKNENLNEVKEE